MSPAFEAAFAFVIRAEGKLTNDPKDRGGLTYRGIARNFHPTWPGWPTVVEKMSRITNEDQLNQALNLDQPLQAAVKDFYKAEFWDRICGDQLPPGEAFFLFDGAVNCGCHEAIEWLQQAVDTTADGVIGPKTLAEAAAHPDVLHAIEQEREAYYRHLTQFDRYGAGWISRCHAAETAAEALTTT